MGGCYPQLLNSLSHLIRALTTGTVGSPGRGHQKLLHPPQIGVVGHRFSRPRLKAASCFRRHWTFLGFEMAIFRTLKGGKPVEKH
jgi:hypothetical protein